jgi:hypothetical protein
MWHRKGNFGPMAVMPVRDDRWLSIDVLPE